MKSSWILFLLIICAITSTGQRHRASDGYLDSLSVRWSPLGLIDPFDGNFTLGIAYSLNTRWTVTADVSAILYSAYIPRNTNSIGYIFKPAARYYLSDTRKFFVEAALFYKHVNYNIHDWLERGIVNGVGSYEEYTRFHFRKNVVGFNIDAGLQKGLIRNNRLRMEIYAGISIRYKRQGLDVPNAHYDSGGFFDNSFYTQNTFTAGIPHGLRIVYVLK
jgi:hypothetical protein